MSDSTGAIVSEGALFRRVEEYLAGDHQRLQRAASDAAGPLGKYFIYDVTRNQVIATHIDLTVFARARGLLRHGEEVIPESASRAS